MQRLRRLSSRRYRKASPLVTHLEPRCCRTIRLLWKMNSSKKSSSAPGPGDEKCPKVLAVERCECDYCSSQRDIDKFFQRLRVFVIGMLCIGIISTACTHENIQLRHELDDHDH